MARYRRSHSRPRPTFASYGNLRIMSMILMLAVIAMLYQRTADPKTWTWLAAFDDSHEIPGASAPGGKLPVDPAQPFEETIVPTPGATDPEEQDAAREEFQALADRAPLDGVEMPAYWRLMRWSRGQSFAELEQNARRDLLFTQVYEQPEKHRGQLIRLRLHVKRTLSHEAPQNSAGVKTVYEAWGWTEESRSFPYLVVFSDLPPQMPLGPDIHEEAVFVGYFMKIMSYQAYDSARGAPLLVGRLQWIPNPARAALQDRSSDYFVPTAIGGGLLILAIVGSWFWRARRRHDRSGTLIAAAEGVTGAQWWEQLQAADEESPETDDGEKRRRGGTQGSR